MNIYEQILAKLQTKFSGADAATLQRIASKKSEGVTDEEKVDSIVEGITLTDVMNNYGDFRAEGASKTAKKNAVADYEKQYNLKDGKPIETTTTQTPPAKTEEETKTEEPKGLSAEDIAKLVTAGVTEAVKPLNDRLDQMDAAKAQQAFEEKVDGVAKSFNIPAFAYKGKAIPHDADLNQYFTDLKQEMQNEGYKFAPQPQAGGKLPKEENEGEVIAGFINDGTKELTEKK